MPVVVAIVVVMVSNVLCVSCYMSNVNVNDNSWEYYFLEIFRSFTTTTNVRKKEKDILLDSKKMALVLYAPTSPTEPQS